MNTISNFHNQQIYSAKNRQQNNNVQFKGLNFKKLIPSTKTLSSELKDFCNTTADILGIESQKIFNITQKAKPMNIRFLEAMSLKYNSRNFNLPTTVKENPEHILNIYKSVSTPTTNHIDLATSNNIPFKKLETIFKKIGNNKQHATLANEVNELVSRSTNNTKTSNPELINELLESKHVDTYAKSFAKYRDYLSVNMENPNAVKELDRLVETKSFNPEKYTAEVEIRNVFNKAYDSGTKIFNPELVREHSNKERIEFLKTFEEHISTSKDSLLAGNDKDMVNMFMTTSKENIDIRLKIMQNLPKIKLASINKKEYNQDIKELNKLFQKIDEDKHATNYVKKLIKTNQHIQLKQTNEILESVPTKKLDIYFENAQNIIEQNKDENIVRVLNKQIENPLYITKKRKMEIQHAKEDGFKTGESLLQKTGRFLRHQFNKIRFALTSDVEKVEKTPTIKQQPIETMTKPIAKLTNVIEPTIVKIKPTLETKQTNNLFQIKQQHYLPAPTLEAATSKLTTKRTVDKAPNAKKFAIISDVNNIIEKKLGSKTLSEQKKNYAEKATKMRLSMLPEIFESIKETRKADKLVGKKKSLSSNKDALELYELINGKNKKLVNYMLKKRNVDGTRQFEVKDIINTLKKAEAQVNKAKQANPNYKSADAKEYYNHLHESFISSYGKPSRTTKK